MIACLMRSVKKGMIEIMIKEDFVLQQIADEYLAIPVGVEADRIHGVIKLNETGAYLWKKLSKKEYTKEELARMLMEKYSIDATIAQKDVHSFIQEISVLGCLT